MDNGKKKVLFIFSSFAFGGAEKMTAASAAALNKYSSDFKAVMAAPKDSSLNKYSKEKGIETFDFRCRGTFTPSGVVKLFFIIKKEKPAVLHVRQGKLFWTALFMKLFFPRLKVILHRTQDTRHKRYVRYHYRIADKVFAVSEAVRNNLIKSDKAPANKVVTVYNGFDFDLLRKDTGVSEIKKEYGLENKTVVGTVGAMASLEGKGQIYLLEALSEIRKDYPDLRCLLVGDGAGKNLQEEYAEKMGVRDIVIFAGYRHDAARYINAMDIFCLLSCDTEGFGNVNVEAQALSKPVITTNIGGIPETVSENKTALIVKPRDTKSLIAALKKLLDDKDFASRMGNEGRKFAENNFSEAERVAALEKIYGAVISAG